MMNFLIIKNHLVPGIGSLGSKLRLDGQQFPLQGVHQGIEVSVGSGKRQKPIGFGRSQHIQIYHGVNIAGVGGKGAVEEVPGARKSLGRCPKSHKKNAPAKQSAGIGKFTRQLQQDSHTGSIAVGAVIDAVHLLTIQHVRIHAQVVHTGANHNVMVLLGLVPAFQEAHHVAGGKGVGAARHLELMPGRENIDSHFPETRLHVFGRHLFSFAAGLATFHLGRRQRSHMLLEGPDGFGVVQVFERIAVLGAQPNRDHRGNEQCKKTFHRLDIHEDPAVLGTDICSTQLFQGFERLFQVVGGAYRNGHETVPETDDGSRITGLVTLGKFTLRKSTVAESTHHNVVLTLQFGGEQAAQLGRIQHRSTGLHQGVQQFLLAGREGLGKGFLCSFHGVQHRLVPGFLGPHALHAHLFQPGRCGPSCQGTDKVAAGDNAQQHDGQYEGLFHSIILLNLQKYAFFTACQRP